MGPWEEQWDSLGTDMSKWEEQELHDDDRQARFWRHRPDGIAVKEKEHIIYILRFERVSDAGEGTVAETPREQQCTSTSLERKAFNTHHFGKYGEGGNTVVHADLAHPEMKALYELVGTLNV